MAIQIVSGNLNTLANAGTFEQDPSTWGFGSTPDVTVDRDFNGGRTFGSAGRFRPTGNNASAINNTIARAQFNAEAGKKYVARVWIKAQASDFIRSQESGFAGTPVRGNIRYGIKALIGNMVQTFIGEVSQQQIFTNSTPFWVQVETRWDSLTTGPVTLHLTCTFANPAVAQLNSNVSLFNCDDFSVFEYQDVAPACALIIDLPNSTVVNESTAAANNGSITVATQGAIGPVEYSINNGITWQTSNVFAGLDAGGYTVTVREVNRVSCAATASFTVGTTAAPTCTIGFDLPNSVVAHETVAGAANGSITIAVVGNQGAVQYSLDGVTWQSSNQFTGLTAGPRTVRIREQSNPGCQASNVFTVNVLPPTHDFTTVVQHETISTLNDGQITVNVTGTGGPFEFSRNGGSTYQVSNVFQSVPPGTYTVVVRNNALQLVAKQVIVLPGAVLFEKIWLSRNPIVYSRQAPANWQSQVNFRLFDEVRLEINTGTSVLTPVHQVALTPINNKVDFQVREAFRGYLNAIPDVNNSDIKRLTDRIKIFRHATGEVTGTNAVPVTLTESLPHLVMMGGLSKYRYASLDFFGQLSVSKQFMTWAPLRKRVDRAQPDYLNFFVWQISATQLKLSIRAYFDDATDQTSVVKTQTGVQYGQLYQIPTGPLNSGALQINPAKNVSRYEVTVLNQSDVAISQTREYVVEPDSHPRKRFILFLNSLGAYEVLLFTGQADTTVGVSKGTLQKFLPITYNPQDGEFESTYSTLRNSTNYSTGYFTEDNAREWQQYMRELLISRRTFDITAGELKPIIIRGGDYAMGGDQEYELFVRFTADDNYAEESYTP